MGGLQIGKEHRHLGIGTIGLVMMIIATLDIGESGQVTVQDREAESVEETHLAVRTTKNMIHHLRSDVELTVVEAFHHQGKYLETKVLTDGMMIQELHTGTEAEWTVASDLFLPLVHLHLLLTRGKNDTVPRNMRWTIFVMSLCHHDRLLLS